MEINYEEIDELMRPIIKILNDNSVKTKFCCQGHHDKDKVYIMFSDTVEEKELLFLLELFDYSFLKFHKLPTPIERRNQFILDKWIRYVDYGKGELEFRSNWTLEIRNVKDNQRNRILNIVKNKLVKHFNSKSGSCGTNV